MKEENEITVEVDLSLIDLQCLLKDKGFKIIQVYDINDIYMVDKNNKYNDELDLLNHCVIIRNILTDKNEIFLIHKYKEYNKLNEIIKQNSFSINTDSIEDSINFLSSINYEELIRINDHLIIYSNEIDEFAVQVVNNKHIYIEIEEKCERINKVYKNIDEMKNVINKYNIPIKNNDYFVKKALIELNEK